MMAEQPKVRRPEKGFVMGQLARLERDIEYLGGDIDPKPLVYILGWPDQFTEETYRHAEALAERIWRAAEQKRRENDKEL